jgi:hypothetical protein
VAIAAKPNAAMSLPTDIDASCCRT